jgi:hypothetical protein
VDVIENSVLPGVKIEFGGRIREFHFDVNALSEIEEQTGKNPFEDDKWLVNSPRVLRLMAWACLWAEDPRPTMQQVGSWITLGNANQIAEALMQARKIASPEPKPGAKKKRPQ